MVLCADWLLLGEDVGEARVDVIVAVQLARPSESGMKHLLDVRLSVLLTQLHHIQIRLLYQMLFVLLVSS